MAILIDELGRWSRIGLQARGVKTSDLPKAINVRPKAPEAEPERITDLSDPRLAAFFARTG